MNVKNASRFGLYTSTRGRFSHGFFSFDILVSHFRKHSFQHFGNFFQIFNGVVDVQSIIAIVSFANHAFYFVDNRFGADLLPFLYHSAILAVGWHTKIPNALLRNHLFQELLLSSSHAPWLAASATWLGLRNQFIYLLFGG